MAPQHDRDAGLGHLDAQPVDPPEALRGRILAIALDEPQAGRQPFRSSARPLSRWPVTGVALAAAIVAGSLYVLSHSRSGARGANATARAFLALPDTKRMALHGASGLVAFNRRGDAWLVVHGLRRAPSGQIYEIWVLDDAHASAAGTFAGGRPTSSVRLTRQLATGSSVVAVSLEPAGGSREPRGSLQFATAGASAASGAFFGSDLGSAARYSRRPRSGVV